MEYELIRARRKTMSLTITDELTVRVRAPLRCPQKTIDEFVASHAQWIAAHTALKKQHAEKYDALTDDEIRWLKALARAQLPARVDYFSSMMRLYPSAVKITSAKKRFGSCSGKNSLCFSYRLMLYPPQAIDYVVVHELAHIRHKNHSHAFYALIEQYLPDYREWERLLRQ